MQSNVIDASVFHEWPSALALTPYMPTAWKTLVERSGDPGGPMTLKSRWLYRNPRGDRRLEVSGGGQLDASDVGSTVEALFNGTGRQRVVLGYHEGILSTSVPYYHLARTVVSAANDWTIEQWLPVDPRLFALALISTSLPEDAAAEIRRVGRNDRVVGIAVGTNALGRPLGNPVYWPIYSAAAEMGLPLVLQVGSDATADQTTPPVAGGLPSTYGEYRALGGHAIMSHAASMIAEGVFNKFPSLQILLLGCGAAWIPPYLWRLDYWYKMAAVEAPGLKGLPSEYFVSHFRIGTYSLETAPQPDRLARELSAVPGIESMLIFASGYPQWDSDEPADVAARLPVEWHDRVFIENARRFFRWNGVPHFDSDGRDLDSDGNDDHQAAIADSQSER